MRVPVSLESQIQELTDRYREWISRCCPSGIGAFNPPVLLDSKLNSEVENLRKLVDSLKTENAELKKQSSKREPILDDLEATRDSILASLKLGKQAPEYKRTKAAIDRFIARLRS